MWLAFGVKIEKTPGGKNEKGPCDEFLEPG
jgi:hypothetical protein